MPEGVALEPGVGAGEAAGDVELAAGDGGDQGDNRKKQPAQQRPGRRPETIHEGAGRDRQDERGEDAARRHRPFVIKKQGAGEDDGGAEERPRRYVQPKAREGEARPPAPEAEGEKHEERPVHGGDVELLAEAGERGVEVAAAEAERAAGEAEEDAERGCRRDVGRRGGERRGRGRGGAAAVVRGPGEGVKAEGDVGEVGPGVGPGAEEVLAVDAFGVGGTAEVAALGEGFPNIAPGVGVVEGEEREDDNEQGAPDVEVETEREAGERHGVGGLGRGGGLSHAGIGPSDGGVRRRLKGGREGEGRSNV